MVGFQSALVLGGSDRLPDGDGGREDGLIVSDRFQPLHEVHPLQAFLGEGIWCSAQADGKPALFHDGGKDAEGSQVGGGSRF